MASGLYAKMKAEATCFICRKLMTDPMSIDCGHSFCYKCIAGNGGNILSGWISPGITVYCPQCKASFKKECLRANKQLQNLIETIKEMDVEHLCEEHGEQLHLFCEDDHQLLCWRCERSQQHKGHVTTLVEDVCQNYKEKLQKIVTTLKSTENLCSSYILFAREQINEWEEKVEFRKQKIQSDFQTLYKFLHEEEKSHLWRLEEEKMQTLKILQDSKASLEMQSQKLKNHILELERKCQDPAQKMLQDIKDTLKRSADVKMETPKSISLELSTVCNVSELYFQVPKLLRHHQVNVTLDPDTAHPKLTLSTDWRSVTHVSLYKKPSCPRRFTVLPCVLGSVSFTSGKHYFEVSVGNSAQWDVGVCLENVLRDSDMTPAPQIGFWAIRLCKVQGYLGLTSPPTPLSLKEKPETIGIVLDYDAGFVAFYNATTGSYIYTFPKASFSQALHPYFQVHPYSPLFLPSPHE
ncbi:E3 ubiquitin-protein ligase TRIM38-like [Suncus etruscus]|uniref:E3 ubiquitin-protein ligase TRIM38-like n=1 Tax=Suncus etruscus TaxID=109475 RepID=UPI0021107211|nr:E3 ubiquitin-protein ligase TRIM38-like [Suncus etruscus]